MYVAFSFTISENFFSNMWRKVLQQVEVKLFYEETKSRAYVGAHVLYFVEEKIYAMIIP
jgi:hypothetical protein